MTGSKWSIWRFLHKSLFSKNLEIFLSDNTRLLESVLYTTVKHRGITVIFVIQSELLRTYYEYRITWGSSDWQWTCSQILMNTSWANLCEIRLWPEEQFQIINIKRSEGSNSATCVSLQSEHWTHSKHMHIYLIGSRKNTIICIHRGSEASLGRITLSHIMSRAVISVPGYELLDKRFDICNPKLCQYW